MASTVTVNGQVAAQSGSFNPPPTVAASIVDVAQWIPWAPAT